MWRYTTSFVPNGKAPPCSTFPNHHPLLLEEINQRKRSLRELQTWLYFEELLLRNKNKSCKGKDDSARNRTTAIRYNGKPKSNEVTICDKETSYQKISVNKRYRGWITERLFQHRFQQIIRDLVFILFLRFLMPLMEIFRGLLRNFSKKLKYLKKILENFRKIREFY